MTRARDLGDFIADGAAAELVVDTTTLVVDSTNNRVGVGTASPATALDVVGNATITVADNSDALTIVSTDADANAGPILKLRRNSASPADNDLIGAIDWTSENSSGDEHDFLNLTARMRDVTAGSEDVAYAWTAYLNGTGREIQSFVNTDASAASMVFNEDSQDIDFRVESNSNTHMLFVDAGNNAIGIGTSSPARILQVDSTNNRVASFRHTDGSSAYVTFSDSSTTDDGSVRIGAIGNDLVNFVGGAERFRIGTSGQLGIGGATYGTSGQILTSGGASAAPSWADAAGGGGQFDAVASGTIANGALVSLNADGTVSTTTQAVGNSTEFAANATSVAAAFDSSANKVVVAYRDGDDSNKGKAAVGTVSGNSITFGSVVQFNVSGTQKADFISVCYDPNANKTAIIFQHDGDADKLKGVVGTVSGTSISFGTLATLDNSGSTWIDTVFDPDTNQIIVSWQNKSNNYGACNVVAISGTDISTSHVGSPFGSNYNERSRVVYDTNSNKVVFFGINDSSIASNAGRGRAVVGTNTSSSISFGSVTTFNTTGDDSGEEAQQQFGAAFDSTANKVVVAFRDARDGNKGKAKTGTVSGTSITFGATTTFSSTNTTEVNAVYDSTSNKTFITFRDDGDSDKGIVNAATINGTNLSFAGKIAYSPSTGNSKWNFPVIDSNSNKLVVVIEDASDSNAGDAIVCDTSGVANFLKWIGFASAAISNSATGTINVLGGINESQSSLEVGATFYLSDAATLSTTVVSGREVGKALSATKLLITQGSVS